MSVTTIRNPLQGERVVGLSPAPAARVTDWNRRLNLFKGRALSASALSAEQNGNAGRLSLRGQMLSPGVVMGLEIGVDTQDKINYLQLAPGFGVMATGEDVFLPKLTRIALRSIPVYAPAALLDGGPAIGAGVLAARRLGPTLDELIVRNIAVPKAGVVVLQPVMVDELANFDPTDVCEEDPASDGFSDEQLRDGCRLVYYAWPTEWLLMPAPGAAWRNRLAYSIFDREALNGPDQALPWELTGLPVGLVVFDDTWNPLFVDRYAVVREGGKPRRRTPLVPNSGNDFSSQARIQQFAHHLTSLDPASAAPAELAKEFHFLPPAGLLPKSAITFQTSAEGDSRVTSTQFFSGAYTIDVVPAPVEQLDLIARESATLAAFDTASADQVTVVVPVPQVWYEPDLLKVLKIDPVFQQAVDSFSHERAIWLKRRLEVRTKYAALIGANTGTPATFPDPDPDAVETDEQTAASEIDSSIDSFRDPEKTYEVSGSGTLTVDAVKTLRTSLGGMAGVAGEVAQLDKPGVGLREFADLLQSKTDLTNDKIDLGFLRVQTDIYRTRQKMLSTEAASRLAVSPALADIAQGASALATKDDIEAFLQKAKAAVVTTPAPAPPTPAAPPPSPGAATGGLSHFSGTPHVFLAGHLVAPRLMEVSASELEIGRAGFVAEAPATPAAAVREISAERASVLFAAASARAPSTADVSQQRPIIGAGYDLRTVSVVERLKEPSAGEVKQFTVASKFSTISNFKTVGIAVGDIAIPGFKDPNNAEVHKTFNDIDDNVLGQILAGQHDPIPTNPGEADIFAAGVRSMENTVEILRLIEGRVQLYRTAVKLCRDTIAAIDASATAAAARLQAIAGDLARARHDVSVAKGLMTEERARIDGINTRRDQIVTQQVRFLAYCRPRTLEALNPAPERWIDPGVTAAAIPACMARNIAAPDELRAFVNLLRDAPLNWFRHIPILIDWLDRLDVLHRVVSNSRLRANFQLAQTPSSVFTTPGPLGPEILKTIAAQNQVVTRSRLATSQFELTSLAGVSWAESRDRAVQLLSIGDLIDLGHYHPAVPRVSASEVENILKVAACLYSDFSAVLPVIRLNWAERLIQIGVTINLANLSSLPRWAEIPILERKEMQALTDWLFSRVNPAQPDAVAHINDLVRVCILLASHAPVSDIISGDVIRDTTVSIGSRVDLAVDLSRVRLSMHVLFYQGAKAVARGVVENLADGVATARVLTAASPSLTLARSTKAHFASPDAFARNPLTASLTF